MHIGIPPIFCKFQFSSQAIHSTLLEKKGEWSENSEVANYNNLLFLQGICALTMQNTYTTTRIRTAFQRPYFPKNSEA